MSISWLGEQRCSQGGRVVLRAATTLNPPLPSALSFKQRADHLFQAAGPLTPNTHTHTTTQAKASHKHSSQVGSDMLT